VNDLVRRLCEGDHPVEVSLRPNKTMEIEGGGYDNNFWQARSRALCNRAQRLGAGRRRVGCLPQKTTAIGCWPAAEADRLRAIGRALKPVLLVTCETLRCAIGCILPQEHGKRTKRILTARPIHQRGVDIRRPPHGQRGAKAIHYNTVASVRYCIVNA
jgi:hypothetical protein